MTETIIIVGASGHAKVVIDLVEREGRFSIAGLVDRSRAVGELVLGHPVIGREEDLPALVVSRGLGGALIAIGDNFVRCQVAERLRVAVPELPLVTAVHPRATIAKDVELGEGTVVMAGVCVNPSARVGRLCILNTRSSLDHDSVMEEGASLAPGVVTGGNCRIGRGAAVGIGAVVLHGVEIGEQTVIGAGSVVARAIQSRVVAYGTPARVIRPREVGDRYL